MATAIFWVKVKRLFGWQTISSRVYITSWYADNSQNKRRLGKVRSCNNNGILNLDINNSSIHRGWYFMENVNSNKKWQSCKCPYSSFNPQHDFKTIYRLSCGHNRRELESAMSSILRNLNYLYVNFQINEWPVEMEAMYQAVLFQHTKSTWYSFEDLV